MILVAMSTKLPAPGDLETVRQFVNTVDIEDGTDQLTSRDRLASWYESKGLAEPAAAVSESDFEEAIGARQALRSLLIANHGDPVDVSAVAVLNGALRRWPFILQFPADGRGRPGLAVAGTGDGLARLLAIVFQSIADGTWLRLKICRSDACQWAFYDHSRNRSGSWCSMAVCGNRTKVRAYQARAKARKGQKQR